MTNINIITRHGHQIQTTAPDLDTARKLLSQPFILVDGPDRFTAIAVSAVEIFDAVNVTEDSQEPTE
jgi:hypothetical protein